MQTTGIDHLNLSFPANRLSTVIDFYVDTLGFTTGFDDPYAAVADDPGLFTISLGETYELFVNPTDDFTADTTNYRHMALRIPQSPGQLKDFLEENDVTINSTADRESATFGEYTSYYIADPFGYTIELMAIGSQ